MTMKIDYDKINAEIGDKQGFKNKINGWICERCRKVHVCIDVDSGITPFIIKCKMTQSCNGIAYSCMYRLVTNLPPQFEWYRPKPEENFEGNSALIEHINRGGLIIRDIRK